MSDHSASPSTPILPPASPATNPAASLPSLLAQALTNRDQLRVRRNQVFALLQQKRLQAAPLLTALNEIPADERARWAEELRRVPPPLPAESRKGLFGWISKAWQWMKGLGRNESAGALQPSTEEPRIPAPSTARPSLASAAETRAVAPELTASSPLSALAAGDLDRVQAVLAEITAIEATLAQLDERLSALDVEIEDLQTKLRESSLRPGEPVTVAGPTAASSRATTASPAALGVPPSGTSLTDLAQPEDAEEEEEAAAAVA